MDKIKGVFTENKESPSPSQPQASAESFTLLRFADEIKNARGFGKFKQYIVAATPRSRTHSRSRRPSLGSSEDSMLREMTNLRTSQKQEAAKLCNCTVADVENALTKFTWAKQTHKKVEKLKEEGKPMPKSLAEVQKLMGSTPLDLARSNLVFFIYQKGSHFSRRELSDVMIAD